MTSRLLGIVSSLSLRERVDLAAGGATLAAAFVLSAIGDVSWILPLAIGLLYAMVVFGTWTRAERRRANPRSNDGGSEKPSMQRRGFVGSVQGALSVVYWSFVMIVLGLVVAWAAADQLTSHRSSTFSFVLLAIGVVLVGAGVLALATLRRHQRK
jgi:Ca2+/Na+ antiporter